LSGAGGGGWAAVEEQEVVRLHSSGAKGPAQGLRKLGAAENRD
jgi:hypothetical protein